MTVSRLTTGNQLGCEPVRMKAHFLLACSILILGLSACQNTGGRTQQDFNRKTERTMNPRTGNFEAEPPYGPRSNKTGRD
jgi:hypothetical protein